MSAECGWIAEPQPPVEWHTPGWLHEKGTGHSHFHCSYTPAEGGGPKAAKIKQADPK